MPSFSTPLSGLNADSQELSVVANNLANLNTVGYKDDVTNFQDLFYQQIGTNGAGDPVQVGVERRSARSPGISPRAASKPPAFLPTLPFRATGSSSRRTRDCRSTLAPAICP